MGNRSDVSYADQLQVTRVFNLGTDAGGVCKAPGLASSIASKSCRSKLISPR